jgi:hypothetical protein
MYVHKEAIGCHRSRDQIPEGYIDIFLKILIFRRRKSLFISETLLIAN